MPRPFEGNYGVTLYAAIAAIAPFIFLGTALELSSETIAQTLQTDLTAMSIVSGLGIAGYAFGALLGGDFIRRFKQRTLFFICEALFVAACLLAANAHNIALFGAGDVLAGLATGVLLVVSLPPAVQRFPASKMPTTAAFVNIGFFGAVTAGPLIGGEIAHGESWRLLYYALAFIGALTFAIALLTLPDNEPKEPDAPFDWSAVVFGFFGTFLPFWGFGELPGHGFTSPLFWAPLLAGLLCFAAMIGSQLKQKEPLSPVKPMLQTVPLCGVLVAMFGGATLVTLMNLAQRFEVQVAPNDPVGAGLLFWPAVLGTLIGAVLLGVLVKTKWLPVFALAGMIVLAASAALMLLIPQDGSPVLMLTISGLLGTGAGATVAPGLWLTGFALPSTMLGRIMAMVELVRSEADFIMAPVILQIFVTASRGVTVTSGGFHVAVSIALCVAVLGTLVTVVIWKRGGARLQAPNLEGWLDQNKPDALAISPGAQAA